jgi:hypothetical protein
MADLKISQLNSIVTVVPSTDVLPVVQSGTTLKITPNQILGSGGTATLASATITGNLTVRTDKLAVTSTGVGCGTTTPGAPLHVQSATAVLKLESTTGTNAAYLYATSTGGDFYFGRDNSTGTTFSTGTGYSAVVYSANAYPMVFFTNATERARIDSSGNLLVGVTSANANGGVLQLKSGITFPATQVAASDANTLDDYEEGTWVGTLKGSTTDPTIAVTSTGRYTKVGRLVTLQISFSDVITTGASGGASISGVPFTNTNITVHGSAASYSALTFSGYLGSEIDANGIVINLFDVRSNNTWTPALHNAGITRYINAEITYTV